MEQITLWIEQNLRLSVSLQEKLFYSLIILAAIWSIRLLVLAVISRRTEDSAVLYRWRKSSEYVALVLGVLLIGRIWIEDLQSAATFLGLLSAGLAIALQDPITNFFGWLFIIWRHPFEVGDRIQIGENAGDVIDVRYFQFTIMEIQSWVQADQSTGRVLHIPNRKVFNEPLANYSKGFAYIWNEIPVQITFESNRLKAKEILHTIAKKHAAHLSADARERVREAARRYMINYENLTPTVYTRVEASGVLLTIRYLCDPQQRRNSEHGIWEDILAAFDEQVDVSFAYPTQRIYFRPSKRKVSHSSEDGKLDEEA
jgi:small-conductance mechanosensitive channel